MGNDQDVVDRDLTDEGEETEPSFFASPKRLLQTAVVVLLLLAAIYILVPKIVGTKGAIGQLSDAAPGWSTWPGRRGPAGHVSQVRHRLPLPSWESARR